MIKKNLMTSALILGAFTQYSLAATWSGADADWSNSTEWGGTVPGAADTAIINSGTATVTTNQTVNATQISFGANSTGAVVINSGGTLTVNGQSNWGQSSNASGSLTINAGGRFDSIGLIDGFTGGATGMTINMNGGQFSSRNNFNADRGDPLTWNLLGGVVSLQRVEMGTNDMTFAGTSTLAAGEVGVAGRTTFTSGSVTMSGNSTQHFDIGGTTQAGVVFQDGPGTYDLINMGSNTLNLGGNLAVSLIDGFAATISNSDSFTIILADTLNGSYDNVAFGERITTTGNEGSFLVQNFGTQVRLTDWTPIPEPRASGFLTGLVGIALIGLRRR